jgi:hypothetical protein
MVRRTQMTIGLLRLFECIGMGRKKGSPRDYYAGIVCSEQPTQKSRLVEPHECHSLYRIGRTQENHQLLHQDSSRRDCERGDVGSRALCVAQLGGVPAAALAWGYGDNDLQAWIYDTLKPYAARLEMGHPAKMKAITAGKKISSQGTHRASLSRPRNISPLNL